jgi:2-oxoglutarate ferredoxin oxidoreductase subunit alpha
MPGLRHRVGGLEKLDVIGTVSHDPLNHQKMTELRQEKVLRAVKDVPPLKVHGAQEGDLLVVGWGGTYGSLLTAVLELHQEGKKIGLAHFNYIYPMPTNVEEIFSRFKKIIVCELNMGQFANFLRMQHQKFQYHQFNKVQGLPFMVFELKEKFVKMLES